MPSRPARDPANPILNSPYEEPAYHYATDQSKNLNYDDVREGRRVFTPDTPVIPLPQQQLGAFDINELASEYSEHLIVRREVGAWRESRYAGVSSRVTRDLLDFWFLNPDRENHDKLFFATTGGGRERDLAERDCRAVQCGYPPAWPALAGAADRLEWVVPAARCLQDGDGRRQDRRDGLPHPLSLSESPAVSK